MPRDQPPTSRLRLPRTGVGAVTRVGGVSREMRIDLDPTRLFALNATATDISRIIFKTLVETGEHAKSLVLCI